MVLLVAGSSLRAYRLSVSGGLPVISTVLAGLPQGFPVPVLVMQHRSPSTDPATLPRLLGRSTAMPVRCACTGMTAFLTGVTVVPGGYVAAVDRAGQLRLTESRALGGDGLLASAAETSGHGAVIAVVLSGMLHDGAEGVRAVKRHGGRVLTQDPATAEAPSMPLTAIGTGCTDFIFPHRAWQPRSSP